MSDLILHHYPMSPFSEKVRLILGHKQLAWKSVLIPSVMPKPDVVALTGGYRRTPFLQIGADIYCDTALIARRLVERGVRFVQLWHGSGQPWDAHDDLESNHRKLAHEADQPIAALLADLTQNAQLQADVVVGHAKLDERAVHRLDLRLAPFVHPNASTSGWSAPLFRADQPGQRPADLVAAGLIEPGQGAC